tara:strand:+ start:1497 stop:2294 length:798 start_codon:yes stop_codon:yes gene_type:complete
MSTKINFLFVFFLSLIIIIPSQPSFAINNYELLPEDNTPVLDLAKTLNPTQKKSLEIDLTKFEEESGWKIKYLSQYESNPGMAIKDYWKLDETSLLIVADPRGGNLLNFNVGDAYFSFLPRLFWVELQTRYGNQYYVRDHGEDGAVIDAINSIKICLNKGGCQVVPGFTVEQYIWTLCTSILGGLVAGFSAAPRKDNEIISISFLALLSPLWGMLFGVFGLAPIITRSSEILPLIKNGLAFSAAAISGYLLSQTLFSRYKSPKKY